MPILAYFAVVGPLLLAVLLAVSAHLDPKAAPHPAEFFGIGSAQATAQQVETVKPQDELSEFARLKGRPLGK